jgi:hypothetical protein
MSAPFGIRSKLGGALLFPRSLWCFLDGVTAADRLIHTGLFSKFPKVEITPPILCKERKEWATRVVVSVGNGGPTRPRDLIKENPRPSGAWTGHPAEYGERDTQGHQRPELLLDRRGVC